MKILYITTGCFDKGGISRYNRYQIQLLRENYGSENVKVVSLLGPDKDSFEEPISVNWHGSGTSLNNKLRLVGQLIRLAVSWKPDLLLAAHVNLSGVTYFISKMVNAPTILNVYGLEVWSKLSVDSAWGLKKCKHILSDCHNTADYLVSHKIRNQRDITVIWDCVDLSRFTSQEPAKSTLIKYKIPDPKSHFNIMTLGRLSLPDALYKGYDRLLNVFKKLSDDHTNIRLIIAGRGNYSNELKKKSIELNISDKVYFTGSIEEADLADIYRSCHVFSLVTEAGEGKGEGIPLTPLEAMACGKPILVGNQDGSKEAVIDNNGFVLIPEDEKILEEKICKYISDPALLDIQSKQALEVAHRYFSYERFKEEHITMLEKVRLKHVK